MYLGGAHGLSGICLTLLSATRFVTLNENYLERIRATVDYVIQNKFPSGNYRSSLGVSSGSCHCSFLASPFVHVDYMMILFLSLLLVYS